jgi:hypothetical protein
VAESLEQVTIDLLFQPQYEPLCTGPFLTEVDFNASHADEIGSEPRREIARKLNDEQASPEGVAPPKTRYRGLG